MRLLLVAALAAAAAAGEPRPAVMPVRSLRGGQLAQRGLVGIDELAVGVDRMRLDELREVVGERG